MRTLCTQQTPDWNNIFSVTESMLYCNVVGGYVETDKL